jgi:hypothetical protein
MARQVLTFDAPAGREVCDFCHSSPTTRLYACRNFLVPRTKQAVFQHVPIGAWSACTRCAAFIEAGHWSALTERSLRHFMQKHGLPRYAQFEIREQLADIHQLFKENMIREA